MITDYRGGDDMDLLVTLHGFASKLAGAEAASFAAAFVGGSVCLVTARSGVDSRSSRTTETEPALQGCLGRADRI